MSLTPWFVFSQSVDTTMRDKVMPRTVFFRPSLVNITPELPPDSLTVDLKNFHLWDEALNTDGFVQTLGQVGKPYLRWQNGLFDSQIKPLDSLNMVTGTYNAYQYPFRGLYFDTRTIYTHVRFNQSSDETQLFGFTVSKNISPHQNITGHYYRRTAVGPYLLNATDNYNIALTTNFRTRDGRYIVFLGASFFQIKDQLNGGVINDSSYNFERSFNKIGQILRLPLAAYWFERNRGFEFIQRLSIKRDSVSRFKGWLFHELRLEDWFRYIQRRDSFSFSNPVPVIYRTGLAESFQFLNLKSEQGILLSLQNKQTFSVNLFTGYFIQTINLSRQIELGKTFVNQGISVKLNITKLNRFVLNSSLQIFTNNVFSSGFNHNSVLHIPFVNKPITIFDSTTIKVQNPRKKVAYLVKTYQIPKIELFFNQTFNSRNPFFSNVFYRGAVFRPLNLFRNEQIFSLNGQLKINGSFQSSNGMPFLTNYLSITLFNAVISNPTYLNSDNQLVQPNQTMNWSGLVLAGRLRLNRIYFESTNSIQRTFGSNVALRVFQKNIPTVFGVGHIYYQNKVFRDKNIIINLGTSVRYFTNYEGLGFNVEGLRFFDSNGFNIDGYLQSDVHLSIKIESVAVYVKLLHLNEGIFTPGYFTVPFYPMLDRAFSFGLNWNLFD